MIPPNAVDVVSGSHSSLFATLFADNPLFQAGFGLLGAGLGVTVLRRGLLLGNNLLRRRLLVSLEISHRDQAYHWFLAWMTLHTSTITRTRPLQWSHIHQLSLETAVKSHSNGNSSASFNLVAGPGTHYFKYHGAWMQVVRERQTSSMDLSTGRPWETVTLTTLARDKHLFTDLLVEARQLTMQAQEGKIVIYTSGMTEWRTFGKPRGKRPLSSVVLAPGVAKSIEEDVKSFLSRRKWYYDRGIPYRRGYLLHGPPGSGKTSFVQALAGSISYDICLLNLGERGMTDDKLIHLLSNVPERCFILIEDIDAALNRRAVTSDDGYKMNVSFSGLLNALDGVAAGEERIIFMTTNHIEHLDPALIRPGRVDMVQLVDDATPEQARTLFMQFYGGSEEPDLESIGERLKDLLETNLTERKRISMAALQGSFIRSEPKEAIDLCSHCFIQR